MDIFKDPTKSIPKSNSQVVRIDFDESQLGARKSHISKIVKKNENTIKHVSGK